MELIITLNERVRCLDGAEAPANATGADSGRLPPGGSCTAGSLSGRLPGPSDRGSVSGRYDRRGSERQNGIVLLAVLVVILLLLATTSAVVSFSVSESGVLNGRLDRTVAFLLAEGAIESAKYELGQNVDTGNDGIGNVRGTRSGGTFEVEATDLGSGVYRLDATGKGRRGTVVRVHATIELSSETTRFPPGGLSLVGELDRTNINLDLRDSFILDGGDGAAVTLSRADTYDWFARQFAAAIDSGELPAPNLTGGVTNTFTYNSIDYDLPLQLMPSYDSRLTDLENTYLDLRDIAIGLQSDAQVIDAFASGTYGSPDDPVTLYVGDVPGVSGEAIAGYGTLIVRDRLALSSSRLDWHGDILVVSSAAPASVSATGGSTINVTGNLIALGGGATSAYVGAWGGSSLNVDGNLFIGTNWVDSSKAEGSLVVAGGSTVSVDGVITMIGRRTEIDTDGNTGNELYVNGMLQVAVPDTRSTSLKLDFNTGVVEIHRDTALIESAMTALHDLGVEQNITATIEQIVLSGRTETLAWTRSG